MRYLGLTRFNISLDGHPVYFTSTDPLVIGDACDSFTDSTPDLANYIVVVQRGICLFTVRSIRRPLGCCTTDSHPQTKYQSESSVHSFTPCLRLVV